jgi:mRNA interferase MazF
VVIVGSNAINILPLRLVVPLLEWKETHQFVPWMVRVTAGSWIEKGSAYTADTLQVRPISAESLSQRAGSVSAEEFLLILHALRNVFEIEE